MIKNRLKAIIKVSLLALFSAQFSACVPYSTKSSATTVLKNQKPIKGLPPAHLNLAVKGATQYKSFGYDFNRDGITDWVMVQEGKTIDNVVIKLSQPNKQYKTLTQDQFDPDIELQSYNFDWKVNIKLTDSGELYIQNNNTDPMSSSDAMSSYRFKYMDNAFVLRGFTHGYTGHAWGKYRRSYLYDLAKNIYQESDTERCDNSPEKACKSAKTFKLKPMPKYTFSSFKEVVFNRQLDKHETKLEIKKPATITK